MADFSLSSNAITVTESVRHVDPNYRSLFRVISPRDDNSLGLCCKIYSLMPAANVVSNINLVSYIHLRLANRKLEKLTFVRKSADKFKLLDNEKRVQPMA